jgi:hypothetical protein
MRLAHNHSQASTDWNEARLVNPVFVILVQFLNFKRTQQQKTELKKKMNTYSVLKIKATSCSHGC